MDSKELAAKITDILDSKKGIDIETVDLTGKTVLADYFLIEIWIRPTITYGLVACFVTEVEENTLTDDQKD